MKKIRLKRKDGNDYFTIIDDGDYKLISEYKWHANINDYKTYAYAYNPGTPTTIYMHRLIMDATNGQMIDHINGNGLDNRKENLRLCTNSQNQANRGANKNSQSGLKGLRFRYGKWQARIKFNRKEIHLGAFSSKTEAAKAYEEKAVEFFGEYAKTNL